MLLSVSLLPDFCCLQTHINTVRTDYEVALVLLSISESDLASLTIDVLNLARELQNARSTFSFFCQCQVLQLVVQIYTVTEIPGLRSTCKTSVV
jgi:hypothetical protein